MGNCSCTTKCGGGINNSPAKQLAYNAYNLADSELKISRDIGLTRSQELQRAEDILKTTPTSDPTYSEKVAAIQHATAQMMVSMDQIIQKHKTLIEKHKEYQRS